jgi:SAM-dependent methyltransferase
LTPDRPVAPATQASSSPLVTSLAQWVWLLEFDSSLAALDASALRTGELAGALVQHFDAVHVVRPDVASLEATTASARRDGWQPATATVAPLTAITLEQGSLDCIAVHDLFVRQPRSTAALTSDLACLARLLRPGGWLSLSSPHRPSLPWRRSTARGLSRRRVESLLQSAGFREVRCLFTEPSLERPLMLVPDSAAAVQTFDAREARSASKRLARRALAHTPLRGDLFSSWFLFART